MQQIGLSSQEIQNIIREQTLTVLQNSIREKSKEEKALRGVDALASVVADLVPSMANGFATAIEANNRKLIEQIRSGEIEI